jgi:Xaa-Pro aminopeptidase
VAKAKKIYHTTRGEGILFQARGQGHPSEDSGGAKVRYGDWVKEELGQWFSSLGFQFVPEEEIHRRHECVRTQMKRLGVEAFLVVEKVNRYYLSGTTQEGLLYVPAEGSPLLLIRRELERAKMESPLLRVFGMGSLRALPEALSVHGYARPGSLALELDVLPVREYFSVQGLFPGTRLTDGAPILREARKIKSRFELEQMKGAGEIGKRVYLEAKGFLKEGMTEIEFGGLMEVAAKRRGHEGLLRVRSLNYEAYTWHVLSGPSGGVVSQSDSPMGGLGLSPAFPVGASLKPMRAHEPIVVDFGICYQGYQVDQTRTFSIGRMPGKFQEAYKACREIHDAVVDAVRPGAPCGKIFEMTLRLAKAMGHEESYLGPPGLQTRFVAHGVGLELNEPPFIALGHDYPLEEGMTLAVEPKIVFAGEGAVGIENTLAVTEGGCRVLTPLPNEIFEI